MLRIVAGIWFVIVMLLGAGCTPPELSPAAEQQIEGIETGVQQTYNGPHKLDHLFKREWHDLER